MNRRNFLAISPALGSVLSPGCHSVPQPHVPDSQAGADIGQRDLVQFEVFNRLARGLRLSRRKSTKNILSN